MRVSLPTAYTTLVALQGATAWEDSAINANPRFVDSVANWHLQSISPAINKGWNVGLTQDIDGNPIVGRPDMGCYEYTTAITVTGRRGVVQ